MRERKEALFLCQPHSLSLVAREERGELVVPAGWWHVTQVSLALTGPQWPRPCHTRNTVMVGPSRVLPLLLLLLSAGSEAQDSCSLFRKEYCSLRLDKIMMLDTALTSPSMCQVSVKRKKLSTLPRDLSIIDD